MNGPGCPVKTGRAPHNADGTQRTESTKGTDPPQFPNEARRGEWKELKVKVNSKRGRRSSGGPNNWGGEDRQSNQDAQSSQMEMNEPGCPVMTGRAPHNADGAQRTESTKGTNPPQFPNKARRGEWIKLKIRDNQCLVPRSHLESMNRNVGIYNDDEKGG